MGVKAREILEHLGGDALRRLRDNRRSEGGAVGGRGFDELRESLARSYGRVPKILVEDLRVEDLASWLGRGFRLDGCTYSLPGATSFPRDVLEEISVAAIDGRAHPLLRSDSTGANASFRSAEYRARFTAALSPTAARHTLRPYQEAATREVWSHLVPGARPLLQLATGGGKTVVANAVIDRWIRERRGRVVWMTKDWSLLRQAAENLGRNFGHHRVMTRIGGDGSELHPLPEGGGSDIAYSTIQTLGQRLLPQSVGLLVWDECHWGEDGDNGWFLLNQAEREKIPVLGLTATPRPAARSRFRVVFSRSFAELVAEGYLARPRLLDPYRTNYAWRPSRMGGQGDFSGTSLEELAGARRRNALIVDTYGSNRTRFGKTIVFACNIEHCRRLARLFDSAGVRSAVVHSEEEEFANTESRRRFEAGEVEVIVNVAKMTHGVDIPSVRTVFLTRPTLSDVLFSQMVGRGSRLAPGKNDFQIVEFTDNLEKFGADLVTAKTFFEGAIGSRASMTWEVPPSARRAPLPASSSSDPRLSGAVPEVVSYDGLGAEWASCLGPQAQGAPIRGAWRVAAAGVPVWLPVLEGESERIDRCTRLIAQARLSGKDDSVNVDLLSRATVTMITDAALQAFVAALKSSRGLVSFVDVPRLAAPAPERVRDPAAVGLDTEDFDHLPPMFPAAPRDEGPR